VDYLHRDVHGDRSDDAGTCADDVGLFPWVPGANNVLLCSELYRWELWDEAHHDANTDSKIALNSKASPNTVGS